MKLYKLQIYLFLGVAAIFISGCSNLNVKKDLWKPALSELAQQFGRKECLSYNTHSQQYNECLDRLNDSFDKLELQESAEN